MPLTLPPTSLPLSTRRVLILEDNEFQREVLAAMLIRMGVGEVHKAAGGTEALRLMDQLDGSYDAVLCDLQVNGEDGIDGVEFIRLAATRQVGALILTSGMDEDICESAEALARHSGMRWAGRIRKPIDNATLAHLLAQSLAHDEPAPEARPRGARRVFTRADLRMALNRHEFEAFYQPKVSLHDGTPSGVEVLARWRHPEAGLVPPIQFIPLCEREGLLDELTEQLLRQALRASQLWRDAGHVLPLAINASALTLQDVQVPNRWRAILAEHGVAPGQVTIEITETAVAADFAGLLETVTRLRMHGFPVSLDDFGTAYSSLQQVAQLPVTELKIDRMFVAGAARSARTLLLFDTIMNLAQRLGMRTVAEGIEDEEVAEFVRSAGCHTGQGFYFGKPMSCSDLLQWLEQAVLSRQAAAANIVNVKGERA